MQTPDTIKNMGIEQFTHGKVINNSGQDVYGFATVARSPGAPTDKRHLSRIRASASVGHVDNLSVYTGSDVAFALDDLAVMARFQRSPRPYGRGYFLQEHYLLLPRRAFKSLGYNYTYLQPLLPDEIPWRSEYENLPALSLPSRSPEQELRHVERVLDQQYNQLFNALQLVLDAQPFLISAPTTPSEDVLRFLETLALLFPPGCRADLSWAINVMNVPQCQARVKVIGKHAVGTEDHFVIRLDASHPSQSLLSGSDAARNYVMRLRNYLQAFGVAESLSAIAAVQVPDQTAWEGLAPVLRTSLWHRIGPRMTEHDLPNLPRPLSKVYYNNTLLPMLDQDVFHLSSEMRSVFLEEVVAGVLEGVIPPGYALRVPRDLAKIPRDVFWPRLDQALMAHNIEESHTLQALLRSWRTDEAFWGRLKDIVYELVHREVSAYAKSTSVDRALACLRSLAAAHLIPQDVDYQVGLLKGAIVKDKPPDQALLLTWLAMLEDVDSALEVAEQVPALASLVHPHGPYNYIEAGFRVRNVHRVDDILNQKLVPELDTHAAIFPDLVLAGERLRITSFRSVQIFLTIKRNIQRLPPERVRQMLDVLKSYSASLTPTPESALPRLMLSAGDMDRFGQLLDHDWTWIDTLLYWLRNDSEMSHDPSICASVFGLGIAWVKSGATQVPRSAWYKRLCDLFILWMREMRGSPAVVNDLTLLLLQHAFGYAGETANEAQNVIQKTIKKVMPQKDDIDSVVADIQWIVEQLFPGGRRSQAQEQAYREVLDTAFHSAWTRPELTKRLIRALRKAGLSFEAGRLGYLHIQKRGPEILDATRTMFDEIHQRQSEWLETFDDVTDITSEQVNAFTNVAERARLRWLCREALQQTKQLQKSILAFERKIPKG